MENLNESLLELSSLSHQVTQLRQQYDELKILLILQDKIVGRALIALEAAATHPETPQVVAAMLLHALCDMKAISKEANL